jgi:hypothetical protein
VLAEITGVSALRQWPQGQYLAAVVTEFVEMLNRISERFPTRTAFAKALGINASRLSRALNDVGERPFNVKNCLRLAKVSGESPAEVLRAAGKADIAELIESLYGPEKTVTDPVVVSLLAKWDHLTNDERNFMRVAADMMLMAHLRWPEGSINVPFTLGAADALSDAQHAARDDEQGETSGAPEKKRPKRRVMPTEKPVARNYERGKEPERLSHRRVQTGRKRGR